jgi:hypothetical protein
MKFWEELIAYIVLCDTESIKNEKKKIGDTNRHVDGPLPRNE